MVSRREDLECLGGTPVPDDSEADFVLPDCEVAQRSQCSLLQVIVISRQRRTQRAQTPYLRVREKSGVRCMYGYLSCLPSLVIDALASPADSQLIIKN